MLCGSYRDELVAELKWNNLMNEVGAAV